MTNIKGLFCIVTMSGAALHQGVETHSIDGVPIKVFNPAKTVVDCFKYRNKVGIDVALEALREAWSARKFTIDTFGVINTFTEIASGKLSEQTTPVIDTA
jgi:predicted transcriptional regulator of viral defense system